MRAILSFSQSNPSFPLDRISPNSPRFSKATPYHRTYRGHQNICFATLPAEKSHLCVVVDRSGNRQGHHVPGEGTFAEGLPEPGFQLLKTPEGITLMSCIKAKSS